MWSGWAGHGCPQSFSSLESSDEIPAAIQSAMPDRDERGRLVSGYASCNGFSAAYRTEGERSISFDDIVSTFIACEDEIMMHERLLFHGLEEATAYTIENSTLQIISENITLTYEAS